MEISAGIPGRIMEEEFLKDPYDVPKGISTGIFDETSGGTTTGILGNILRKMSSSKK